MDESNGPDAKPTDRPVLGWGELILTAGYN